MSATAAILIGGQDIARLRQSDLRSADRLRAAGPGDVPPDAARQHRVRASARDDEEIYQAVQAAHVTEFACDLPDGFGTMVGERGVKLSGGQRQRVALARAILRDAPILLLDEATSALDSESETLVQQALWRLMEGRTALAVAHRLSTVARMDQLVGFDHGQIAEEGHAPGTAASRRTYARLWQHQSGGFLDDNTTTAMLPEAQAERMSPLPTDPCRPPGTESTLGSSAPTASPPSPGKPSDIPPGELLNLFRLKTGLAGDLLVFRAVRRACIRRSVRPGQVSGGSAVCLCRSRWREERQVGRRGRAGRCPGAADPCCSAPGTRPGRRVDAARRGSASGSRSSRRRVPTRRSQIAFIRGAWTPSLVSSPWMRPVSPQGILFRQAGDEPGDAWSCRRAAGRAPLARVVFARDQPAVPGQQRRWRNREDGGPAPAGYEPCQRGEPHPVSRPYRTRLAWRRSTAFSWRSTSSSASFARSLRYRDGEAQYPAN